MKKQFFIWFIPLAFMKCVQAQITPPIEWQKCLGGSSNEAAFSAQQTNDGGYIVAGYSDSDDGDVSGNNGSSDYWVVKLDDLSNLQWQNSIGGNSIDEAHAVKQTIDGGFIVAGFSYSNNGDVTGNHGSSDFWIVKLGTDGNLQWQKTFGGSSDDGANSIQQTTDNGFVIAGYSSSNDGDVSGNHGMWDYWIVKTDSSGNLEWQKSFGGSNNDVAYHVEQTNDNGYVVSGYSESNDGDLTGNDGARDYWIVKLDSDGEMIWQTHLGSSGYDEAFAVLPIGSEGYMVGGFAGSNDFDVSGNHGGYDYWVVELDSSGTMLTQKCFGGTSTDQAFALNSTNDGGYIVAGQSLSNNGDVTDNHGGYDCWAIKLDADMNLEWQKALGGSGDDYGPYNIQQTSDNGYFLGGSSLSNDGDVSGNHGGFVYGDEWTVKLAGGKATGITSPSDNLFSAYPNPVQNELCLILPTIPDTISIRLYDLNGRILNVPVNFSGSQIHLKVKNLPEGIYTWEILLPVEGTTQVGKFVKCK